ncbi:hypothetical protein IFM89_034069 [Coptis chinensis]|uniref:Uncharacterized protein n=1 Tax=Coptis chinensis TaxID=261450 RepID=A0A835ISL2_9MAGN|nr:hypothetical protein IFM89_034069 [Coptis chinensis]
MNCHQSACKYFLIESGIALFIAFLINVAVVSVTGDVCSKPDLSVGNRAHCNNITLETAALLLKNVLGKWSSIIFAVSLLASGQSSMVTGTYAGQYIMQGFLDLKMKLWLRNLLTRCIAIVPSLVVTILFGSSATGTLIIIASVAILSWVLGFCLIGVNMYFLGGSILNWLVSDHIPKAGSIFAAFVVLALVIVYMGMLIYLTLRKENAAGTRLTVALDVIMTTTRSGQETLEIS